MSNAYKRVTLTFLFKEVTEDDDYTYIELEAIEPEWVEADERPTAEEIDGYLEGLVQSDFHTIGFPNAVAEALSGRYINFEEGEWDY